MLSRDLAEFYKVTARELNQQVKRNRRRFPRDFVFQLTDEEAEEIRVQILGPPGSWRGKLPYAFTEQGAGMLATVLRSPTAATVTIEILRAFARLREPHEPPESTPLTRRASNLFAAFEMPCSSVRGTRHSPPKSRPRTSSRLERAGRSRSALPEISPFEFGRS